jgi:D-psicose/D-tagatose/L-ribulose 3-epimerase
MKLSCLDAMLGERPLAERFELARAAGFDGLDLRGDELAAVVDEARELARRTGVEVPTVYGRLRVSLVAATAAERMQAMGLIRERLGLAARVGAKNLIVVPVFGEARFQLGWPGGVEQAELAVLAVELQELAAEAEAQQVAILLEPLNRQETHLLRSPRATADLVDRIGSPWVATMADAYHMDREEQDMAEEVRLAGDRLRLVHLSDRDRRLPGQAGIDFRPLLAQLRRQGYTGYLGFECRGRFELDDLRQSVGYVRALG